MKFKQITIKDIPNFDGDLYTDETMRTLYATDASAYRELPVAVAIPKNEEDIQRLITFANYRKVTLIPRAAGTSLAGQVVGSGMVVDISRTFTKILEVNESESWVRMQPGVVRDELNVFLKKYGLFFGPETSTANRAMMGGMVGNNSCGSNSIIYGSTRDHLMEVKGFLSDGSYVTFADLTKDEFNDRFQEAKSKSEPSLEDKVYVHIGELLSNQENQAEIRREFPKRSIKRRNTGYAIDELLETEPFTPDSNQKFSFCKLIAGSEGTLMFITEIKLHLNPLPPEHLAVVAVHFNNVDEALQANLIALKYNPSAVELMDHYILECTKANREQRENRFFVQGEPGAILVVELFGESQAEIEQKAKAMELAMRSDGLGYHFPVIFGDDIKRVWTLRKAGLGLLSNLPGDEKAVPVIEDTAVDVNDLPEYIREFNTTMNAKGMNMVHYAHAGSGELHLRPIINLKTHEGNALFREVAQDISTLVKKYKGSLSGEHGDGRLRAEFIKEQIGEKNYESIRKLKYTWDPNSIFNANKIVDTPPMNESLRYTPGQLSPTFETAFRYKDQTVLQHAEQCNGSGDCRKTEISGGTMCPSYMATRNEKDTTRARANILREALTNPVLLSPNGEVENKRFNDKRVKEVMDLCLACKGCKSECPSNVDVAKLKMEFLYHYQKANGTPLRSRMIGNFSKLSNVASYVPWAYNMVFKNAPLRRIANSVVGFHPDRTIPLLHSTTVEKWFGKQPKKTSTKKVYLFCDEFTNYNDVEIGKKTVDLFQQLGYEVIIPEHDVSGRAYLSKGMLDEAKQIANRNVEMLSKVVSEEIPLVGIEPSAILTFRDEYPELVDESLAEKAVELAKNVLLFDEFIVREIDAKRINRSQFKGGKKLIRLHGHCQQKAVGSLVPTKKMLSLPEGYTVQLIPSGCCGMAGSFGYEKEHYDLSMQIGELVLFPTVRAQEEDTIIAAPGTSCRHQIHDGTGRKALHPIEILWEALKK
ncbi:MAG: FAD/FMN-containing dehydrogenase/Fe-S oxidoreductase [Spirosomataceae bacterium]|jgi:FAD/FMN-containing dehydrogenase/Fe-S oxidoreductase